MNAKSEVAHKYFSSRYALELLRTLELKITPPNQFNDPFEFYPRVISTSPEREAKRILKKKDEIKGMYEEEKTLGIFKGNFRNYRERIRKMRPNLIPGIARGMPKINARLQHNYLDGISTAVGVLSLSKRSDSIVMWSHYGDNHRGLVIGFNTSWEIFRAGKGLCPVHYARERLIWDSNCKPGSAAEKTYVEEMIRRKNDEWAYEDELRQLFVLEGLKRKKLTDGNTGYFLPIPSTIVVSVFLGTRCPSDVEAEVKSILRDPRFAHVGMPKRAKLHNTDFAIQFE